MMSDNNLDQIEEEAFEYLKRSFTPAQCGYFLIKYFVALSIYNRTSINEFNILVEQLKDSYKNLVKANNYENS